LISGRGRALLRYKLDQTTRGDFMIRVSKTAALCLTALFAISAPAWAAEILIKDAKSQPESLPPRRTAP